MADQQALQAFDATTGAPVTVDAAQAGALYRSGQIAFSADQDVPIVGDDGRISTIKGSQAGQFFDSAASITTQVAGLGALAAQQRRDEYGTLGQQALTVGQGAVNGLFANAGEAGLVGLAGLAEYAGLPVSKEDWRQSINARAEVNPGLHTTGEVLGFAAPALLSGGSSLLARGAVGGAGMLARGAEGALAYGLGESALARGVAGGARAGVEALGAGAADLGMGLTAGARGLGGAVRAGEGLLAEGLGGGAFARGAANVLGQGVELGVYGAGGAVNNAVLHNEELTGEQLFAGASEGFLMGAGGGAALGLGGAALRGAAGYGAGLVERAGVSALERFTGEGNAALGKITAGGNAAIDRIANEGNAALGRLTAEGNAAIDRLTAGGKEAAGALMAGGKEAAAALPALGEAALQRLTSVAEGATGRVGKGTGAAKLLDTALPGGIEGYAAEKAIRGTGANQKIIAELEEAGAATKEKFVRQTEQDLPEALGKKPNAVLSYAEQAEAAVINKQKWGARVGDNLAELDKAMPGLSPAARPNVENVVNKVLEDIITPLRKTAGAEGVSRTVENYLESLQKKASGSSFTELHQQRRFLDDLLYSANRQGSENVKALKDVRRILDGEINRAADVASKEIGAGFSTAYQTAKQEYRAASLLEKATAKGATRDASNASTGLSELLGGLGGSHLGSAVGGAVLGPVGSLVGGVVGGITSAYVQGIRKRFGDQAIHSALRRIQQGATPAAAFGAVLEEATGKAVAGFFKNAAAKAPGVAQKGFEAGKKLASGGLAAGKELVDRGVEVGKETGLSAVQAGKDLAGRGVAAGKDLANRGIEAGKDAGRRALQSGRDAVDSAGRTAQGALLLGEKVSLADRYNEARDTVAKMDPAKRADAIKAAMPGASPIVIKAAQDTAARSTQYLQSKIPASPTAGQSLQPQFDRPRVPPSQMQAFLDAVNTVDDPTSVLRSLERGRISPDQVEALQTVYPQMYQQVQQQVMAGLSNAKGPVSYQARIKLGVLLKIPTDPTLQPDFIREVQTVYAKTPAGGGPGPADAPAPPPPAANVNLHASDAFSLDRKSYQ